MWNESEVGQYLGELVNPSQWDRYQKNLDCDFAYGIGESQGWTVPKTKSNRLLGSFS